MVQKSMVQIIISVILVINGDNDIIYNNMWVCGWLNVSELTVSLCHMCVSKTFMWGCIIAPLCKGSNLKYWWWVFAGLGSRLGRKQDFQEIFCLGVNGFLYLTGI